MKIRSKFLLWPSLLPLLLSCEDEANVVDKQPVVVSFQTTELVIAENGGSKLITLSLDKLIKQEGEIVINVSSISEGFVLAPEPVDGQLNLAVLLNQDKVTFKITPKDNSIINSTGDEIIVFTLSSVSEGLVIGNTESLHLTITDDEIPSTSNFALTTSRIRENNNEGIPVVIALSHAASGTGLLTIALESKDGTYGKDYITVPEAVNGKLNLSVEKAAVQVSFRVLPLNDYLYNGNRNLAIKIDKAEGAISRGLINKHDFVITDDELATKGKGYTNGSGQWAFKKEYSYNLDGTVAKVEWEQATPGTTKGTIIYHYDANGKLLKSTDNPVQETVYTWENNQIVRSERIKNGVLVEYKLYGYDEAGNVGEVSQYNKNSDDTFVMSLISVFLYYTDGNIHKQLMYHPGAGDPILISTRTYGNYLTVANPFTMVDILPNKKTQINLPGTYKEEENDSSYTFDLSYEFDDQGRPTTRTSRSGTLAETVNYHYFD